MGTIAKITVEDVGINFEKYTLTRQDVLDILEKSFR